VTDDIASGTAVSSASSNAALTAAWAGTRDVGSHLFRHRAGIRPGSYTPPPVKAPAGVKASAQSSKVAAIVAPVPNRWEVFGSLFYYNEDRDGGFSRAGAGGLVVRGSDSTLDVFGGTLGLEYNINRNWSVGFAVSGSESDLNVGSAGNVDIDSLSLVPYVTYYQEDVMGDADFWASGIYGYGMHSYDIQRNTGAGIATSDPDADTHLLEANVGLSYGDDTFVHGPYAGLRYITGTIDAYNEIGPGGAFVGQQDLDSFVSILGYQASWKLRSGYGYWVSQLRLAWEHEFEDGGNSFGLPGYARDEDVAVLGAGLGYWWDNGWRLGVDYEGRFGDETTGHYGSLNVGKAF
jgi:uncharacterized protein with beta-barrel porin domain